MVIPTMVVSPREPLVESQRMASTETTADSGFRVSFERMTVAEMVQIIKEDYIAHGRDWTKPGFRAIAAHRFGNWRMNIRWKLLRAPFSLLYHRWYRKNCNCGIEIDFAVRLGRRTRIEHQGAIVIHSNSMIGDECVIRQGVTLGIRSPRETACTFDLVGKPASTSVRATSSSARFTSVTTRESTPTPSCFAMSRPDATAVGVPARIIESRGKN